MDQYQYETSYFPLAYYEHTKGEATAEPALPTDPDPSSLYDNPKYIEELRIMGLRGWELVSVQPVLRGCYDYKMPGYGLGFSIVAGYLFFWKRVLIPAE